MRWGIGVMALACLVAVGCAWKARSGLPAHIRTVEVEMFGNVTFEPGLEGKLTRALKTMVNEDPQVRLVNDGGDARISGKITRVIRKPERLGRDDRPVTMSVVVEAEFSFYDVVEQKYFLVKRRIDSRQASSLAGQYRPDETGGETTALDDAVQVVARSIARETVGMW